MTAPARPSGSRRTGAIGAAVAVTARLPVCAALPLLLHLAEDRSSRWYRLCESLGVWITGAPRFGRWYYSRVINAEMCFGAAKWLALALRYRSFALMGAIQEAEAGFRENGPIGTQTPDRLFWLRMATASLTEAGDSSAAARFEAEHAKEFPGSQSAAESFRAAMLYARALEEPNLSLADSSFEAIRVIGDVLKVARDSGSLNGCSDADLALLRAAYYQYLEISRWWHELLSTFDDTQTLRELSETRRAQWARSLQGVTKGPMTDAKTRQSVADQLNRYYATVCADDSATAGERIGWLLSTATASLAWKYTVRAKACFVAARQIAGATTSVDLDPWTSADLDGLLAATASCAEPRDATIERIARRVREPLSPARCADLCDSLTLGPTWDAHYVRDEIRNIGRELVRLGHPAHRILSDLTEAAAIWEVPDLIPEFNSQLERIAQEHSYMEQIPKGMHEEDRKELAGLLARVDSDSNAARPRREDVERVAELVLDISPAEDRIEWMVRTAGIAAHAGYNAIAESCLHGARRICLNYGDKISQSHLFRRLTSALAKSGLRSRFGSLCEGVFREARNTARNAAALDHGLDDKERAELKELARYIDEDWDWSYKLLPKETSDA